MLESSGEAVVRLALEGIPELDRFPLPWVEVKEELAGKPLPRDFRRMISEPLVWTSCVTVDIRPSIVKSEGGE